MSITRRRVLGLLSGAAAAIGVPSVWIYSMKIYDGPPLRSFRRQAVFRSRRRAAEIAWRVLRWQFGSDRQRQAWPEWAPSPHADTPPARVSGDKVRLSFVGHASWLIQTSGLNILIDPVWSERASPVSWAGPKRHNDPGIAFDALPPIDVALVSHGHYDHLDLATLSKLAAKFLAARDHAARQRCHHAQRRQRDPRRGVRLASTASNSAAAIAVTLVPTRHWSARGLFDRNKALWASFVLETPAGKIFIVCDSGYGEGKHFRRVGQAHGPLAPGDPADRRL